MLKNCMLPTGRFSNRGGRRSIFIAFFLFVTLTLSGCYKSHGVDGMSNPDGGLVDVNHADIHRKIMPLISNPIISISAGYYGACAVRENGDLYCWGTDEYGHLGVGKGELIAKPTRIEGLPPLRSVAVGNSHSCGITMQDRVWCWGRNQYRQRSESGPVDAIEPSEMTDAPLAKQIAVGTRTTCILSTSGDVFCRGSGDEGQLMQEVMWPGKMTIRTPEKIAKLVSFSKSICTVDVEGATYCWGDLVGHASDGSRLYRWSSVLTTRDTVSVAIASGVASEVGDECAVLNDGRVTCWERRSADQTANHVIENISGATTLALGNSIGCALIDEGQIKCWGRNWAGQLGLGNFNEPSSTSRLADASETVHGIIGATDLAASNHYVCAIAEDGGVLCWGDNRGSELGIVGTEDYYSMPQRLEFPN